MNFTSHDGDEYEMVGGDDLPDTPVPIVVTGNDGQPRWTVSIPPSLEFPLSPSDYSSICSQSGEVSQHVTEMLEPTYRRKRHSGHKGHFGYDYEDPNFMDVAEAEAEGLLPGLRDGEDEDDAIDSVGEVCEKSLTFVLQTEDAGLGKTLLRLWMSYGLAQKEGRAFFLDDTNWAYGKYTSYFQPPPSQDCLPPPRNQIVPCPHHARHLLISSATTSWAFGHGFTDYYEDARKMGVERQERIFSLLRSGYEALFALADEDAAYYNKRVTALNSTVRGHGGIEVGVHVRHGDVHPREFQYQKSYIPLEKYVAAAQELISVVFGKVGMYHRESAEELKSKMIFASDDPEVYFADELSGAEKAQYQISLASKSALDAVAAANGKGGRPRPMNIGWEGGFFKDIFWSLGAPRQVRAAGSPNPSKREVTGQTAHSVNTANSGTANNEEAEKDFHFHPTPEALRLRELVGRGYLLDLAVLAQTDQVVCGISSSACRILAVMMGWEKAIVDGDWNNVDGTWSWKGIVW